jgi:hypothetical protein
VITRDYISTVCGWRPGMPGVSKRERMACYAGIERVINDPLHRHPIFGVSGRAVLDEFKPVDTFLYEPLLYCNPNYQRGAQGIGDCVAWGAELACTLLTAKHAFKLKRKSIYVEAATESIYGGSRVEAMGRATGGYSDGSYGAAAADWVKKWGVTFRKDYSADTGNPEHDLRGYSSKRAKNWGNFGCGGQNDKDALDDLAKTYPVQTISQVNNSRECAAVIAGSKCPVTIASMYGTDMVRDKNGYCKWNGSWAHQMCLIGVRFDSKGNPEGFLNAQSWGPKVASGPHYPANMPENIKGFTWWIPASDVDRICQGNDSWAYGDIDGWKIEKSNWLNIWGKT